MRPAGCYHPGWRRALAHHHAGRSGARRRGAAAARWRPHYHARRRPTARRHPAWLHAGQHLLHARAAAGRAAGPTLSCERANTRELIGVGHTAHASSARRQCTHAMALRRRRTHALLRRRRAHALLRRRRTHALLRRRRTHALLRRWRAHAARCHWPHAGWPRRLPLRSGSYGFVDILDCVLRVALLTVPEGEGTFECLHLSCSASTHLAGGCLIEEMENFRARLLERSWRRVFRRKRHRAEVFWRAVFWVSAHTLNSPGGLNSPGVVPCLRSCVLQCVKPSLTRISSKRPSNPCRTSCQSAVRVFPAIPTMRPPSRAQRDFSLTDRRHMQGRACSADTWADTQHRSFQLASATRRATHERPCCGSGRARRGFSGVVLSGSTARWYAFSSPWCLGQVAAL